MTHMIDESHTVDVAYLGFAKVFHSLNHRFLLNEFKSLGLGDVSVRWIEAHLTGRVLRVHVSGECFGNHSNEQLYPSGQGVFSYLNV